MHRVQWLLVPKYQENTLKQTKHPRADNLDSIKQESITKSDQIRDAHEILGLGAVGFELDTDPDTKHDVILVLN